MLSLCVESFLPFVSILSKPSNRPRLAAVVVKCLFLVGPIVELVAHLIVSNKSRLGDWPVVQRNLTLVNNNKR
jgi:hypothetical protein